MRDHPPIDDILDEAIKRPDDFEPIARAGKGVSSAWRSLDHDMDAIATRLARFFAVEGFA